MINKKSNKDHSSDLFKKIFKKKQTINDFSSEFEKSVYSFTPDDIKKGKTKKKSFWNSLSSVTKRILLIIFSLILAVFLVLLSFNIYSKIRSSALYDQILKNKYDDIMMMSEGDSMSTFYDNVAKYMNGESALSSGSLEQLTEMRKTISALKEENADVYGWIYCEGTDINYPICQTTNNDYYLDHAYNREYIATGCIFVDYQDGLVPSDNLNTVLYGHNIVTGTMFHDVSKYFSSSFFNSSKVYLYTLDGIYVYEPFAINRFSPDYPYFTASFDSTEDFLYFANDMKSHSQVSNDATFTEDDRLLTLSTCTNSDATGGRYALHCKLIQVIN